eukprot:CAMPEP_0118651520 /NCGR_PEP_ID=MMETSP0785-20121206/10830_1 /TAXON_ID=91992 /ORGANISM="Bolidomonas pacifica, Strain CCMP 1866" /LENGTH=89 /DNA_ID=CAMNT_0006543979 /DNA_START=53 /DNA_END=319 /DNA_ORIENTATION=-
MCNNVLIEITHYSSVSSFLLSPLSNDPTRPWLATALVPSSISLYSPSTSPLLRDIQTYNGIIFVGSEGKGLDRRIMEVERCVKVVIPSM